MIEIKTLSGDLIARVDGNDLSREDFSGGTMTEVDFAGANLKGCNFHNANLERGSFVGADLRGAILTHARLHYVTFERADLTCADLTNASLAPCNLAGANLCGANLTGADLHGATLRAVRYDAATIWPDSVNPDERGAVRESHAEDLGEDGVHARDLLRAGEFDQAISLLQQAVAARPEQYRLHHLLGCAYGLRKQIPEARACFAKALELRPTSATTLWDMALVEFQRGALDSSEQHLDRLLAVQPDQAKAHKLLKEIRRQRARATRTG